MSSVSFSDASAREEPPRRKQRTLSTVERDALQSVLDVVERETDSEHTKGMSRFTFFLGLANLVVSAFLLGACTESFWLALAGLVFSLYLGSAWYDRMLTSHVTKKVRKHIAASTAKKD